MALGFSGEVAQLYNTYRRGYPAPVIDAIVDAFGLTTEDVAIDLGCGTGQLTLPLAARVRAAVGVDPEPDMLALARRSGVERGVLNVTWLAGDDTDVRAAQALLGSTPAGVVTAATALHWMRDLELFTAVASLVRPGGGFAVVTNGKPLWLLDVPWSHALREFLERRQGRSLSAGCGTDDVAQQRYRDNLAAAGFEVSDACVAYSDDLDLDHLVGGMLSAFSIRTLPPPDERRRFSDGISEALGDGPFTEDVRVGLIFGRRK